jgi:hypothetical protein
MVLETGSVHETVEFTEIKVPTELAERIVSLARRKRRRPWEIVLEAIGYYEAQIRNPRKKEKLPDIEKVSWYVSKVAVGVALFLANPTHESLTITKSMVEDVGKRLKVDTGILAQTLEMYFNEENKTPDKRATVMHALKMVIREMIAKAIEGRLKIEGPTE